jgi:hypothetical protein
LAERSNGANTIQDFFELALLHVELMQRNSGRAWSGCWSLEDEDRIRFAGSESDEVSCWNRQRQDALADTVKIDSDFGRRFRTRSRPGLPPQLPPIRFLLAFSRFVTRRFRLFVFGDFSSSLSGASGEGSVFFRTTTYTLRVT